ncbi:MAG: energy-coupling factor ABC transporter ATP-binding protein [Promethearchaeota archaeon]
MAIIEFKDVSYKIGNFKMSNITFKIEKGEIFAIAGTNGSGKTTLFRLIVNLIKPESGEIYVDNIKVEKSSNWKIRSKIGFLFQNPDEQLFTPSVYEDVAFGPRNMNLPQVEIEERIKWTLESVNLWEYRFQPPSTLSWGQKKRAALAAILAMKPKILLLDEPFANLDINTITELIKIFNSLNKELGITIVFASHNQIIIQNWSDRVLVLDKGNIIYLDSAKEYIKDYKVHNALGTWQDVVSLIKNTK